jgi:hypothetical protein
MGILFSKLERRRNNNSNSQKLHFKNKDKRECNCFHKLKLNANGYMKCCVLLRYASKQRITYYPNGFSTTFREALESFRL